jgi:hypothetical protein
VFSFYIFTFLMFRKLNKSQLTKIKQHNCIGIRAFDSRIYLDISSEKSRLYLDISRSFNYPKCSPVVCLICYYLQSVNCFCIARIHFKQFTYSSILSINYARPEILVSCLVYIDQLLFLNKLLVFVFSKAYYQESYNSVVNVAEWLDGSFELDYFSESTVYSFVPEYMNFNLLLF